MDLARGIAIVISGCSSCAVTALCRLARPRRRYVRCERPECTEAIGAVFWPAARVSAARDPPPASTESQRPGHGPAALRGSVSSIWRATNGSEHVPSPTRRPSRRRCCGSTRGLIRDGSTRGLIRGNLASGGLVWDVPCEWTPAGGFLRPCGLCGFDTPKRCQGLTSPESLGGRRALA